LDTQLSAHEAQQALHERMRFYRDLGISSFYRRPVDESLWASQEPFPTTPPPPTASTNQASHPMHPASPTRQVIPPSPPSQLIPEFFQDQDMAPRKPFPPPPPITPPTPPEQHASALQIIRNEIGDCTRCGLSQGRNKLVFGDGDPNARLFFVGEGPGADEDASGIPFVGKGGQLLNNMIAAMGLRREQVYIANVVKCRPPANRTPEPDEAHTCSPYLFRQIDVVRPEVIVALGQTAVTYLMGEKRPLAAWRGSVHPFRGSKLIVTYHPAFLLRDPNQKKFAWADLQIAMRELGLKPPQKA
jgi:uracil-DNA glycosylase